MCNHAGAVLMDCRTPFGARGVFTRALCLVCIVGAKRGGWSVRPHEHDDEHDYEHESTSHRLTRRCMTPECGAVRVADWVPCDCGAESAYAEMVAEERYYAARRAEAVRS